MEVKPGAMKRLIWMVCLFPFWGPFPFVIGTWLASKCFHALHQAPVHIVEQRVGSVVWLIITCIVVRLYVFAKRKKIDEQTQMQPQMGHQMQ
ncbi:hypothetical protein [Paraburkholderia youngii]|uniref:hypothetical protein n=1 Tax=Paraburkholderia youngii TaxID=2782701 RepID=UPI003D1B4579